jgi:hypothetical protein
MLWALRRTFKSWNATTVPRLLATFIRPILEYGAPAYFPATKSENLQLERVQRLATRMVPTCRRQTYIERCLSLRLFTLEYRRTRMDLIFTFKILCLQLYPGLTPLFPLAKMQRTRGHPYKIEKCRLERVNQLYCLSTRIVNLWNSLPAHVVTVLTTEAFKSAIDAYLWYNDDTWKSEPSPGAAYPRHPSLPQQRR